MGKCAFCGEKTNFWKLNTVELERVSKIRPILIKHNIYVGSILPSIDYCHTCIENFFKLMSNKDVPMVCEYFKSIISKNNMHANIVPSAFDVLLEKYIEKYNNDNNYKKAVSDVKLLIVEKRKEMQEKYGLWWESPTEYEYQHMCATRYENNLIILENREPKFNFLNDIDKANKTYDKLKTISNEDLFMMSIIPLENILSYQLVGNVEHVSTVSGGGGRGGQPSLYGAAIGGLLFGGAGAVIGAQTGVHIDPIKSDIKEFDSRKTLLNLKNSQGQAEIRELPYYYSEVFMKVIPEKEFNFLQADKSAVIPTQAQTTTASNMIEEVKKLKELLDLKLITQEQFTTLVSNAVATLTTDTTVPMPSITPIVDAQKNEDKDDYEVELTCVGSEKIKVLKEIKDITFLGLAEAKAIIDNAPAVFIKKTNRETAENIKRKFERLGATITIR